MTEETMERRRASREQGAHARPRRRPLVLAAAVVAVLLAAGLGVLVISRATAAHPTLAYTAGCPRSPMSAVPNPQGYQVEVPCARITGTAVAYRLNEAYDDLELTVVPARPYRSALPPANNGRFVVWIVGPDLGAVKAPDLNRAAVFYGSWVENRATHALMLMPSWRITTSPGNGVNPDVLLFALAAARHSGQSLRLSTDVPATMTPGTGLTIPVTASWQVPAAGKHPAHFVPASQILVLVEIIARSGKAVAWKAARTGTLGLAAVRPDLVAITGHYTCRVYAITAGRVISVTRAFAVGGT